MTLSEIIWQRILEARRRVNDALELAILEAMEEGHLGPFCQLSLVVKTSARGDEDSYLFCSCNQLARHVVHLEIVTGR